MPRRFRASSIAFLLVLSSCCTRAPCAEPRPVGRSPDATSSLPFGCKKLADGTYGILSPDGRRLAYVRWMTLEGTPARHPSGDDAEVAQVRVLDLEARTESVLPDEGGVGYHHIPIAWGPRGTLVRHDGSVVNSIDGKPAVGIALPPVDVKTVPESLAWTNDGARLAYLAPPTATPAWNTTVFLLDRGGVPVPLTLTDGKPDGTSSWNVMKERPDGGRLAWGCDGEHLFAELRFHVDGHWRRFTRAGVLATDGRMNVVATSMNDVGDDRAGAIWDAAHEHFVLLHDWLDWGADVLVSSADGARVELVSDEASIKWSPAFEPSGRRVAFLAHDPIERDGAPLPPTVIRIVDRHSRAVESLPLAVPGLEAMHLAWTPDGARLVYELAGDSASAGIYAQSVPPANACVEARRPAPTLAGRVVTALGSDVLRAVEWAVDRARETWEPEYGPALVGVSRRWTTHLERDWKGEGKDTMARLVRLAHAQGIFAVISLPDSTVRADEDSLEKHIERFHRNWHPRRRR